MDNLLKEAIADAKAVRETALANAKIALEEAFTPKLQRMLSAKLAQEDADDSEAVEDEDLEEQADTEEPFEDTSDLPAEESGDEAYEDNDVEDGMSEDEVEENDDMEEPMEDTSPMGEGEEAEEDEDLDEDEVPAEEDEEAYEDDELDLEAIIRELEADAEEDEEPVEEQSNSSDIGEDDNVVEPVAGDDEEKDETDDSSADTGKENEDDEVVDDLEEQADDEKAEEDEEPLDLESIIKELEDEMEDEEADEEVEEESAKAKLAKVNADLAEHRKVVRYLSSKLHEVNLLNAKLLYTNKLFRAHSLKESQKLRVIETFDRAKNLREVKLVFTTMAESFGSTPGKKRKVTESAASRPTASTKPRKQVITEGQELANRFRKLAGIK
jgi:hypothetical protein